MNDKIKVCIKLISDEKEVVREVYVSSKSDAFEKARELAELFDISINFKMYVKKIEEESLDNDTTK